MTKISCKLFEGRANSVDIYVHPKNVEINKDNHHEYFKAWYMELGKECSCYMDGPPNEEVPGIEY